MTIFIWIVFGALVGWVASVLMDSRDDLITNICVGIVGSILGGYILSFFGQAGVGGFTLYSFIVALIGACVLIVIARAVRMR